ncbi:MAG: HEPN domain-containing protein [archaeon]
MPKKTQDEKKLEWCLNKAKREIKETGSHRGLVKINPNSDVAKQFLQKAEHNLKVFLDNKKLGNLDWCISMGFYSMYHCCLSILAKYGYESRNQECTLAAIRVLVEDKKIPETFVEFIDSIKKTEKEGEILSMREKYQYSPNIDIDKYTVENLEAMCKTMITETRGILI